MESPIATPEERVALAAAPPVASFYEYGNDVDEFLLGFPTENPKGCWHFVAGVYNAATSTHDLWWDGAILASKPDAHPPEITFTGPVTIGAEEFGITRFWLGAIDDVRVYDRALSESEMLALAGEVGPDHCMGCQLFSCAGFETPLAVGPVTVRGNRALPLKARLFDSEGNAVGDSDLTSVPVVQVFYTPPDGVVPLDVTEDVVPAGQSSDGNQFSFDSNGFWHFNLKTGNHSAPGTYSIFMVLATIVNTPSAPLARSGSSENRRTRG